MSAPMCPLLLLGARLDWAIGQRPKAATKEDGRARVVEAVSCKGSRCMMWRWHHQPAQANGEPRGYCGLASKPAHGKPDPAADASDE